MCPRRIAALLAVLCLATGSVLFLGASPASAHASLVRSTPTSGAVVDEEPRQLRLEFSEPVESADDAIAVTAPNGQPLLDLQAQPDADERRVVAAALPAGLRPGTYVVRWQVLSIDGHPVRGEFRFAFGTETSPLGPATSATDPSGPSAWSVIGRALSSAGSLAVVGLAAFPLLVMLPARRRLSAKISTPLEKESARRLRIPLAAALAATLVGTVLVVLDTVAQTRGAQSSGTSIGEVVTFLTGTRTGLFLSARIALLVVVAVLLIPTGMRFPVKPGRVTAGLVASLLALVTISMSSHAAAVPADTVVAIGFDVLHLVAAGLWAGGLLGLALGGIPGARAVGGSNRRAVGDAAAALSSSFSVAAQLAMLAVLTTGGYLALLQISALEELAETAWGVALTIKIALWVTVLLFASANAIAFVPRLAERAAKAKRRLAASDELGSAVRLELVVAGALIAIAAVMSATAPPAAVANPPASVAAHTDEGRVTSATGEGAGYRTRVQVSRSGTGEASATVFRVQLTTQGTRASSPSADALLRGPDGVDRELSLQLVSEGEWVSQRLSVAPGRYRFTARFLRAGETVAVPVSVTVPS